MKVFWASNSFGPNEVVVFGLEICTIPAVSAMCMLGWEGSL